MLLNLQQTINALTKGEIVGIPTETVYGLAGIITKEDTLKKIFQTKKRPSFDPLIIHVSNQEQVENIFLDINENMLILMKSFWPGPLTIVSKKSSNISSLISAELETVAVRMPNHEKTLKIIKAVGPLAAPSANMFKKTSPTSAQHVLENFNNKIPVFNGGDCQIGIESTVIEVLDEEIKLYRKGKITKEEIQKVLPHIKITEEKSLASPGHMKDHYQPKKPLYLFNTYEEKNNFSSKGIELNLTQDAGLSARMLYRNLIELSQGPIDFMYFIKNKYPKNEFWDAIYERLEKASSEVP